MNEASLKANSVQRKAILMAKTALVAIGGNSLIRAGEKGTIAEQLANTRRTAEAIVGMAAMGYRLVITHGNGPQVGAQLLRSERASDVVYGQTLDVCGAASQGEIGHLLAQSLQNELAAAAMDVPVVSLVTQTVVSPDDPAMLHPSKPIGPFYSRAAAEEKKRLLKAVGTVESIMDEHHLTELDLGQMRSQHKKIKIDW